MSQQAGAPGAKSTLPPIPKMDAATPAASTAGDLRSAIREIQQEVKKAVADEKQSKADARRATTDAKKATADAKVQAKQAQDQSGVIPTTAPPPAFPNQFDDIPPQVMNVISMTFTFIAILALGVPLVRVFARRLDRKTQALQTTGPDLAPALRTLQESVDAMAIEVERISEGQRFTSKLLAERAALASGAAPDRQPVS